MQFTVSTFREGLEEYLYCNRPAGIVRNVQWIESVVGTSRKAKNCVIICTIDERKR